MARTLPPRYYISPTEPTELKSIGRSTLLPETMGCDVLVYLQGPLRIIGIQRKEIRDLFQSLSDGRLAKQLGQMTESPLAYKVIIIEGTTQWTNEGKLISEYGPGMTRSGWQGLMVSIQLQGVILLHTSTLSETVDAVQSLSSHLAKPTHSSLLRRPKSASRNAWGKTTSNAFALHLLQSFSGIGPTQANSIYQTFQHAPLQWSCTYDELVAIPGIGPSIARRLLASLDYDDDQ